MISLQKIRSGIASHQLAYLNSIQLKAFQVMTLAWSVHLLDAVSHKSASPEALNAHTSS